MSPYSRAPSSVLGLDDVRARARRRPPRVPPDRREYPPHPHGSARRSPLPYVRPSPAIDPHEDAARPSPHPAATPCCKHRPQSACGHTSSERAARNAAAHCGESPAKYSPRESLDACIISGRYTAAHGRKAQRRHNAPERAPRHPHPVHSSPKGRNYTAPDRTAPPNRRSDSTPPPAHRPSDRQRRHAAA